jgi:hypothetical protein
VEEKYQFPVVSLFLDPACTKQFLRDLTVKADDSTISGKRDQSTQDFLRTLVRCPDNIFQLIL